MLILAVLMRLGPASGQGDRAGPAGRAHGYTRGRGGDDVPGGDRAPGRLLGRPRLPGHDPVPHRGRARARSTRSRCCAAWARTRGGSRTSSRRIRPTDGRYGENPFRLQHYFQYQVLLKPSPDDVQDLYLELARAPSACTPEEHDIRFVEDDWEGPTLGAWGLGWEVWLDGMEITQFTYFQQAGGIDLAPISVELTYGLERIAMYLQGVRSVYDLEWGHGVTYGDLYQRNEAQWSRLQLRGRRHRRAVRGLRRPRGASAAAASTPAWCCRPTTRC